MASCPRCHIRPATDADFDAIWPIFQTIVAAGETYTYPRDTTREQAFDLWLRAPRSTFVAIDEGEILGTYFIKTNQLWMQLGFDTVGRLPQAFRHPELGFVDALVMFKWLAEAERT